MEVAADQKEGGQKIIPTSEADIYTGLFRSESWDVSDPIKDGPWYGGFSSARRAKHTRDWSYRLMIGIEGVTEGFMDLKEGEPVEARELYFFCPYM